MPLATYNTVNRRNTHMQERRAVIAGGGPAGLTCGTYLARAGWSVSLFTDEERSVSCLSEAPLVENFPGFPDPIPGAELLERMSEQASRHGVDIRGEGISLVDRDRSVATDTSGTEWVFDAFVKAVGTVPRKFSCRTEPENASVLLHTCAVCDGGLYGKSDSVAVIGAGDTAFGDALYLSGIAGEVHLIARRDVFRTTNRKVAEAFKSRENCFVHVNSTVTCVRKNGERDYELVINGGESCVHASGIFACIGFDENDIESVGNANPNVFGCGDCVPGAARQAVIAAASGAETALKIIGLFR